MIKLRRGLPPLPDRIKKLPLDPRGYPIPWFVAEVDGKRDFRIADADKRVKAVQQKLCWLCGEKLGRYLAFVVGPMCAVNRNTSEPPCHRDCALFAVQACPFLILPKAEYRRANLPEDIKGHMYALPGNPGAVCIWITLDYKLYQVPGGSKSDWLIRIGEPIEVLWYAEGKPATRQQILDSFDRRLGALQESARSESPEAEKALADQVDKTMQLLPAI
jgi:hypothetical protein